MKKISKKNFKEIKKVGRPTGKITQRLSNLKVDEAVTFTFKSWKMKSNPALLLQQLKKKKMWFATKKTNRGWAILRIK